LGIRQCAGLVEDAAAAALVSRSVNDEGVDQTSVASPPPAPAPQRVRLSLHISELLGRNGERFLAAKLFGVSSEGVSTLVEEDVYARPVDRSDALDELEQSLAGLRARASEGRLAGNDIRRAGEMIRSLLSRSFWDDLADELRLPGRVLEIHAHDASIPWELVPIASAAETVNLGTVAPMFRRRTALQRPVPDTARRNLLLLGDLGQPGAAREIAMLDGLWSAAFGRDSVQTIEHAAELRALERPSFSLVHYAGHQGPARDGTPSIAFDDDSIPIAELVDRLHEHPPECLFLHACSTLSKSAASTEPGMPSTFVFGALEPLVRSRIAHLIGTQWDVSPPSDAAFIRHFYESVVKGTSYLDALHSARIATADRDEWKPWWPAYVMLMP